MVFLYTPGERVIAIEALGARNQAEEAMLIISRIRRVSITLVFDTGFGASTFR